ncbi:hypothetical protein Hanom_Chr07g00614031 [Helianthus anomalus]
MELTSRIKMARFQTFWIQMRKNNPLNESRKTGQTSGTKWHFTLILENLCNIKISSAVPLASHLSFEVLQSALLSSILSRFFSVEKDQKLKLIVGVYQYHLFFFLVETDLDRRQMRVGPPYADSADEEVKDRDLSYVQETAYQNEPFAYEEVKCRCHRDVVVVILISCGAGVVVTCHQHSVLGKVYRNEPYVYEVATCQNLRQT